MYACIYIPTAMSFIFHAMLYPCKIVFVSKFCVKYIWIINKSFVLMSLWKRCIDNWNPINATFLFMSRSCVSYYWRYWTLHTNSIWGTSEVIQIWIIISAFYACQIILPGHLDFKANYIPIPNKYLTISVTEWTVICSHSCLYPG